MLFVVYGESGSHTEKDMLTQNKYRIQSQQASFYQ